MATLLLGERRQLYDARTGPTRRVDGDEREREGGRHVRSAERLLDEIQDLPPRSGVRTLFHKPRPSASVRDTAAGGPLRDPAELLHGDPGVPDLGHVPDLVA